MNRRHVSAIQGFLRLAGPLALVTAVLAVCAVRQFQADAELLNGHLVEACERGDTAVVTRLLARGASPNNRDKSGMTPLGLAVRAGSVELIRALVDRGADVNSPASGWGPPLIRAAANRRLDVAELLLASGANPDARDCTGGTPLWYAAVNGDVELIEVLVAAGARIDAESVCGLTPLRGAIDRDGDDAVRTLLRLGTDPGRAGLDGQPRVQLNPPRPRTNDAHRRATDVR
jgi:ankyrin repeat protein